MLLVESNVASSEEDEEIIQPLELNQFDETMLDTENDKNELGCNHAKLYALMVNLLEIWYFIYIYLQIRLIYYYF